MNVDCEKSLEGIFLFYSNFVDAKYGDGNSSIFGIMDPLFTQKLIQGAYTDSDPDKKIFQFNSIQSNQSHAGGVYNEFILKW